MFVWKLTLAGQEHLNELSALNARNAWVRCQTIVSQKITKLLKQTSLLTGSIKCGSSEPVT